MFDYDIIHIPGKQNIAPDTASRYPPASTKAGNEDDDDIELTSQAFAVVQGGRLPSAVTWSEVNNEAIYDQTCSQLKDIIEKGFPEERSSLPENLRYFWNMRYDLYLIENTPFKRKKMLIPVKLRPRILEGLHAGHQGVSSMRANARERLFWPRLDADIENTRAQC